MPRMTNGAVIVLADQTQVAEFKTRGFVVIPEEAPAVRQFKNAGPAKPVGVPMRKGSAECLCEPSQVDGMKHDGWKLAHEEVDDEGERREHAAQDVDGRVERVPGGGHQPGESGEQLPGDGQHRGPVLGHDRGADERPLGDGAVVRPEPAGGGGQAGDQRGPDATVTDAPKGKSGKKH